MKSVKVFYWVGEPNFGDILNIDLCKKLFEINPIAVSPEECEASFLGSVLDDFLYKGTFKVFSNKFFNLYNKEPVKIWGSGFITDKNKFIKRKFNLPETYFRKFICFAVRGKQSLERLKNIDIKQNFDNTVIGDPGLLASNLLDKIPDKKYKIGLIPHHAELNMPIWKELNSSLKDSTIIRVDDTVENTIKKIAQCEVILSSAMHGLIVADSFNIPNIRVIASDKLIGGDYKFNDYYSALGIKDHQKINLKNINNNIYKNIVENYQIDINTINTIKNNLIKVFPYKN